MSVDELLDPEEPPSEAHYADRFSIVPEWITEHPELSDAAVRVFSALARFTDRSRTCYPSAAAVGERIGKSERRVRAALRELEAVGAIHVRRRRTSSIYTLAGARPFPRADEIVRASPDENDRASADENVLRTRTTEREPLNESAIASAAASPCTRPSDEQQQSEQSTEGQSYAERVGERRTSKRNRDPDVCTFCYATVPAGEGWIMRFREGEQARVACDPGDGSCREAVDRPAEGGVLEPGRLLVIGEAVAEPERLPLDRVRALVAEARNVEARSPERTEQVERATPMSNARAVYATGVA